MIEKLQTLLNTKQSGIETWMDKQRKGLTMPIYSSFDIRDNGIKASVVDSNLFPSGFHRLTPESQRIASTRFREGIEKTHPHAHNILIYPLPYSKNQQYIENLITLLGIISNAGYDAELAKPFEAPDFPLQLTTEKGTKVTFVPLVRERNVLTAPFGKPDIIILNTDFYKCIPPELIGIKQPLMPTPKLGWHSRTKYAHFVHYNSLVEDFSKLVGIDPWFLHAELDEVREVDFREEKTVQKVAKLTDLMIERISAKYKEYGVKQKPYVVIKDNSGTYGRGIFIASSGSKVLSMNSAARRSMKVGHESHPINSVIIQEGIETKYYDEIHGTGEPVLYQVGRRVVGGFMRVHKEKSARDNLNSPGMEFRSLYLDCLTRPLTDCIGDPCELSLYSIIADLATIAIGREIKDLRKKK